MYIGNHRWFECMHVKGKTYIGTTVHRGFTPLLMLLALYACQRVPNVQFSFEPEDHLEAGEVIRFINDTKHATSFIWDFGDGGISRLPNPNYIFEQAGIFSVKLTAFNEEAESYLTQKITIHEPTLLGFIVFDTTETLLEGADVWIYDDEKAWDDRELPLLSGITGEDGKTVFMNVEPTVFYVWVFREEAGGSWYYRGYTPTLTRNDDNWFNVPCVWLPDEPHQ